MDQHIPITPGESDHWEGRKAVGQAALTPLLDTLFLLLFSVLAASDGAEASTDIEEEVRLELPSVMDDGESGAAVGEPPVVIAIEAEGTVTMDGGAARGAPLEVGSPAALAGSLASVAPGTAFEIRAHADARHAVVVEVLHGLREAGFLDVSLVATKRASGAESKKWGSEPR